MFSHAVMAWNPKTHEEASYYIGADHRDLGIVDEGVEKIRVFPEAGEWEIYTGHGKYTKCFSFEFKHVWNWSED